MGKKNLMGFFLCTRLFPFFFVFLFVLFVVVFFADGMCACKNELQIWLYFLLFLSLQVHPSAVCIFRVDIFSSSSISGMLRVDVFFSNFIHQWYCVCKFACNQCI